MRILLEMDNSRIIALSRPTNADPVKLTMQHNVPGKGFVEAEFALYIQDVRALIAALQAIA